MQFRTDVTEFAPSWNGKRYLQFTRLCFDGVKYICIPTTSLKSIVWSVAGGRNRHSSSSSIKYVFYLGTKKVVILYRVACYSSSTSWSTISVLTLSISLSPYIWRLKVTAAVRHLGGALRRRRRGTRLSAVGFAVSAVVCLSKWPQEQLSNRSRSEPW